MNPNTCDREETIVTIPRLEDRSSRFEYRLQGDAYETNLSNIDEMIKDMREDLKSNRGDHVATSVEEDTGETIPSPQPWWDMGSRCAFEWVKESFLCILSERARGLLRQEGIHFFQWRGYDSKVTLDASRCSMASMLKPWTPSKHGNVPQPLGITQLREDTRNEAGIMKRAMENLILKFDTESSRSESLATISNSVRVLLDTRARKGSATMEYRRSSRKRSIMVVSVAIVVSRWWMGRCLDKLLDLISCYVTLRDRMDTYFFHPIRRMEEEKENFRSMWNNIKDSYDAFLCSKDLIPLRGELPRYLDILTNEDVDFEMDFVRLLRDYIDYGEGLDSRDSTDEHDKYRIELNELEDSLRLADRRWSEVRVQHSRMKVVLEEEMKSSLHLLMSTTYATFERDIGRLTREWRESRSVLDRREREDMSHFAMERSVAEGWISNCEGRWIRHDHVNWIGEVRILQSAIEVQEEYLLRIDEFEESYVDLIHLWRIVFSFSNGDQ